MLRKDQPHTARSSPAYLHLVPHYPAMHTRKFLSRVQLAIRRKASSIHWSNDMDGLAQSRLYQVCRIAGKVCLPAEYARLFRLSSHALKPGQSMSCLNMQAPQRWSFNIRVLVLLGVVGKRKLFLLCIRLFCAVPLFTASPSWYLSRFLGHLR
jgi:hypothetical protein